VVHRLEIIVVLLAIYGSGCTDAHLSRIAQSEDGTIVAFSDLRWENVWLATPAGFVRCGKAPFCVSPEGTRVVAMEEGFETRLAITELDAEGHKTMAINVDKCIPPGKTVREMRCTSNHVVIRLVSTRDRLPEGRSEWLIIDLASGQCTPGDRTVWEATPAPIGLDESQTNSDSTQVAKYTTRNGTVVRAVTSPNARNTVELIGENGKCLQALFEDPLTYCSKLLANAGFQPP